MPMGKSLCPRERDGDKSFVSIEFRLFLGVCNSERAAEAIVQSSVSRSPVIGLRFNSIRVDYSIAATSSAGPRSIKLAPCAVRVDIYNG